MTSWAKAVTSCSGTNGSKIRQSPRLFFQFGRLASTSNGFLFSVTRLTSLKVRFKQTASRISRRTALSPVEELQGRLGTGSSMSSTEPRDSSIVATWAFRCLQVVALGLERGLVDRAGEVGVEQAILHVDQFAPPDLLR